MIATFKNSMDVLVRAYMNDTLQHMNCAACAVRNLIASANNINLIRDCSGWLSWEKRRDDASKWLDHLVCDTQNAGIALIESTGYSVDSIRAIEESFEKAKLPNLNRDEQMFLGLLNVLDVLCEIHRVGLDGRKEYADQLQLIHES